MIPRMGDRCRIREVLFRQLSQAVDHYQKLENQKHYLTDRASVVRIDSELKQAAESVERFKEALKIHVAIHGCGV
jgi:hypothetical protein